MRRICEIQPVISLKRFMFVRLFQPAAIASFFIDINRMGLEMRAEQINCDG